MHDEPALGPAFDAPLAQESSDQAVAECIHLHQILLQVESLFPWLPDTEWIGRREQFTLLQARPITIVMPDVGELPCPAGATRDENGRGSILWIAPQALSRASLFTKERGDQRDWYLSLRPGSRRLGNLAERVAGQLIPELEALGKWFAAESMAGLGL